MNYGIKETKELAIAGLTALKAYRKATSDGKIDWTDARFLPSVIKDLSSGLNGVEKIKKEVFDITDEEQKELADLVRKELEEDMQDSKANIIAVSVINWVLDGVQIAALF